MKIKCPDCDGDGLNMCRVDGCDYDPNRKCLKCKGVGYIFFPSFKCFVMGNLVTFWCSYCDKWHTHGAGYLLNKAAKKISKGSHCDKNISPLSNYELQRFNKEQLLYIKELTDYMLKKYYDVDK